MLLIISQIYVSAHFYTQIVNLRLWIQTETEPKFKVVGIRTSDHSVMSPL